MSLAFPERRSTTRRAMLGAAAAIALSPVLARAGCPCAEDDDRGPKKDPAPPAAAADAPITALRVCADPNNLPFSNRAREGFEDRVAALIAADLGLPLEYQWLPQRLGFYRTALKTFDTNLVMAAPAGFDKALVTRPYYRSTYVFVQRKDAKDPVRSLDDDALRRVKVGVPLTGGANTPPTHALSKRRIIDNVTGYSAFDETTGRPGERIVSAAATGEVDVAIAWGPQAAYFAGQQKAPLAVTPVSPAYDEIGDARMAYTFGICMALRRPDRALRARIDDAIARRQREIDAILDEFAVPRLPLEPAGASGGTAIEGQGKRDVK